MSKRTLSSQKNAGIIPLIHAQAATGAALNPSSLLQPAWYVDPVAGNDAHDGTSPATAVKTIMGGIVKRWGTSSPILTVSVTVFVLQPEAPEQEEIVLSPVVTKGVNFAIVGCRFAET